MAEMLRAVTGFLTADRTVVKAGQIVSSADPVVKGREQLFEPADPGIEQATRAPGEKRITGAPPDTVIAAAEGTGRRRKGSTS